MKRNIFIILVATLFILLLIYFFDKRIVILNKEYINQQKNIHIEYPYFNSNAIDNYLDSYLKLYLDYEKGTDFFIDYDYNLEDSIVELILYFYKGSEGVFEREIKRLEFDLETGSIIGNERVMDTSLDYDFYFSKEIDKDKPMIALTFDDGPNHNTVRVLDILEGYGIRATFFILGCNIEGNEKVIKRMDNLGMEIGNHMYSHKLLTKLSNEKIKSEVEQVDEEIFDIIGKYPTLVRPSYGTYNNRIKKVMDKPIIIWNIDTLDWKYHSSKRIANNVLKKVSDGDIVLMHDIYSATANSLKIIIPKLLEKGYQFVTVSELLYYKGITMKEGNVYSRGK